jgi:hypothetical protein
VVVGADCIKIHQVLVPQALEEHRAETVEARLTELAVPGVLIQVAEVVLGI